MIVDTNLHGEGQVLFAVVLTKHWRVFVASQDSLGIQVGPWVGVPYIFIYIHIHPEPDDLEPRYQHP